MCLFVVLRSLCCARGCVLYVLCCCVFHVVVCALCVVSVLVVIVSLLCRLVVVVCDRFVMYCCCGVFMWFAVDSVSIVVCALDVVL